ncbi:MAG: prolipoprotein diacylglyceryl transferase [Planctomycetes bacterium]|nr:prolipoprotein diacylglyceryl transferase [Planctomycetota bacterium]
MPASTFAEIAFPPIDPVIFRLGPFALRWYALGYILGIVIGWRYLYRLIARGYDRISRADVDDLIVAVTFGIILGGRLGYVLFYKSGFYLEHPAEIVKVWEGGMSFHGGLVGTFLAVLGVARWKKIPLGQLTDVCSAAAPIGIGLVRIANFINQELYGRPTDVPWAVRFKGVAEPRHPSQIYEALLEGLTLFLIMFFASRRASLRAASGRLTGIFLLCYGLFRSFAELFREPDAHLGFIVGHVTMGQILSVPLILVGLLLVLFRRPPTTTARD